MNYPPKYAEANPERKKMPINFGPFQTVLDADGPVTLVIRAGPNPVVSCNAALFRPNPVPPNYVAVRNPFWTPTQTTSNVLPPVIDVFAISGTAVATFHLVVLVGFSVLAPSTDPAFKYTALIEIMQNDMVKQRVLVELTNADLDKWHKYALDFTVHP